MTAGILPYPYSPPDLLPWVHTSRVTICWSWKWYPDCSICTCTEDYPHYFYCNHSTGIPGTYVLLYAIQLNFRAGCQSQINRVLYCISNAIRNRIYAIEGHKFVAAGPNVACPVSMLVINTSMGSTPPFTIRFMLPATSQNMMRAWNRAALEMNVLQCQNQRYQYSRFIGYRYRVVARF